MPLPRLEWACALVLALALLCAVIWLSPGAFSIDEATYQWMVDGVRRGQAPAVWNGYREQPSPELASMWIRPSGGRLIGQYPYLFILMAAPFQAVWGFRGLFVLSGLAYLVSVWLCWRLALELHGCRVRALGAAGLFGLATFSIDYGLAAWPHALAVAIVLLGACAALRAWRAEGSRQQSLAGLGMGATFAIGMGVRIDVGLAGAVVLLPFLFGGVARLRPLAFAALGASPPVALLCAINWARWGSLSPLSYGRGLGWGRLVLPVALLAVAAVGQRLLRSRRACNRRLWWLGVAAAGAAAVMLAVPSVSEAALSVLRGIGSLAVDMRMLPLGRSEPAMVRTAAGGVLYFGTLKKALLQSCPYLGLLTLSFLCRPKPGRSRAQSLAPLAVPAFLLLFYGRTGWHGGMAFNQRYLTLALPLLAIACADPLVDLCARRDRIQIRLGLLAFCLAVGGLCLFQPWSAPSEHLERLLLDGPLAVAGLTVAACVAWWHRPHRHLARAATTLVALGVGWASAVAFAHDLPRSHALRARNYAVGEWLAAQLPEDCLLFADHPDAVYSVRDHRRGVRVALPHSDDFKDMLPLTLHHLRQGRLVAAFFPLRLWEELSEVPAMQQFHIEELSRRQGRSLRSIALPRLRALGRSAN